MYKCLANQQFKDQQDYQLVPIRQEDIEKIRLWRNAQRSILRQQEPLSEQDQLLYFQEFIWPSFAQAKPKQILFSYLSGQECIGYGGLTHLDWEALRAEVSFLVNPERIQNAICYRQDFKHYLSLLCQVAFKDLNLHRLFTETFAYRTEHIHVLESFGFVREGVLRDHIYKNGKWSDSIMHGLLTSEASYA